MPNYTEILELEKPLQNEYYDVDKRNANWDKIDDWAGTINEKTQQATDESYGITKYGTVQGTALEGHRLAESLGVKQYGGTVQEEGTKLEGYSYYCTANQDMYLCTKENSLNYTDASYFTAFSNNALLNKLNNLYEYETFAGTNGYYVASCYKIGKVVTIFLSCAKKHSACGGSTVCTLPKNFRPPQALMFTCNSHNYKPVEIAISENGTVIANCIEETITYTYGTISYSVYDYL